ncbi:hypothetical protein HN587_01035 [Candidatus Woesearchaeota archaeon]|jgi:hypothetical protein|nr:hypothetical protein [Candidatus Woesearchaeota archaeon]
MTNPLNPHKPVKKRKNDLKHLVRLCHKIITTEDKIAKLAKKEKQDMRDGKINQLFKDLKRELQTDRRELSKCKKTALAAGTSAQDLTIALRETKNSTESTHLEQLLTNEAKLTHFLYHLIHGKIIPLIIKRIQAESDEIKNVKNHDANALKQAMQKDVQLSQELKKYKPIIEKIILHLQQLEKADQEPNHPITPGSHHSKQTHQIALVAIFILIIGVVLLKTNTGFAQGLFDFGEEDELIVEVYQDNALGDLKDREDILRIYQENPESWGTVIDYIQKNKKKYAYYHGYGYSKSEAVNSAFKSAASSGNSFVYQNVEIATLSETAIYTNFTKHNSNNILLTLFISADKNSPEKIKNFFNKKTSSIILNVYDHPRMKEWVKLITQNYPDEYEAIRKNYYPDYQALIFFELDLWAKYDKLNTKVDPNADMYASIELVLETNTNGIINKKIIYLKEKTTKRQNYAELISFIVKSHEEMGIPLDQKELNYIKQELKKNLPEYTDEIDKTYGKLSQILA